MLNIVCFENQSQGTDYIINLVAADVAGQLGGRVLMVPELISHDMERRLCEAAGDTASRYAEVLSFSRLARRVMDQTGSGAVECLDEGGRILAMAAAARNLISRLKAYAGVHSKPDFLKTLVDTVDECKRCCIMPQQFEMAAGNTTGTLSEKLTELAMIMTEYDRLCLQSKRDPRDQMTWVLDQLADSDYAYRHTFYIDGFPDFSRQHLDILEQLIRQSPMVTVCLVCDGKGNDPAFEKAEDTLRQLQQIAKRYQIDCHTEFLPEANSPMAYIRRNLFHNSVLQDARLSGVLFPVRADSVYQECQAAAERIQNLVHTGARYRDIALACTDLDAYRSHLRLIFRRCGIPLYLAGTEDVQQTGVMETVLAALDAALDGMEQRSVLHYLRCALSPLSLDECDSLENYAVIWGISGKRWDEEWTAHPDGLSGIWDDASTERLTQINRIRKSCIDPLLRLRQQLLLADNLGQQVEVLHSFLLETQFPQRLERMAVEMEAAGARREAQICNQLWDILISALEQMHDVLGQTAWNGEDFSHLLRLLLSQYDVGTIPPVLDAVTAGNVSAMRCQREKHLLILGGNEGSFPGSSVASGLFTDQERLELRSHQILLSGGSLEGLQTEFAEINCLLCGAQETVAVYCSQEPSFLFRRLAQMAGGEIAVADYCGSDVADEVSAAAYLVRSQNEAAAERLGIEEAYHKMIQSAGHNLGSLAEERVPQLYGQTLNLSASQVDRQAECRLSYFLKYGLRAKERKEATVDPAEFGTYVHDVLEHTAREVMVRGGFHEVSLEDTLAIAEERSKAYLDSHFSALDSKRMEYLFRRNVQELELVVEALWQELHRSEFVPKEFELQFDTNAKMPPIEISGAQMPARLRGFVDRVDIWEHAGANFVRVVDYKTGKKDFDYCDVFNGVGLQMLLYLFALEDGGAEVAGEQIVPAGVQYFPARVPYITATSPEDPEWEKERQKQFVRKGLLLSDEASLTAMDPTDNMQTLNCKRTRDGSITGDLADRGQMLLLKRYVMHILRGIVNDIASGNVDPNPYTRGTSHDACTFCPYGAVCHKNEVQGRRNYKRMEPQRFWEEIGKELNDRG